MVPFVAMAERPQVARSTTEHKEAGLEKAWNRLRLGPVASAAVQTVAPGSELVADGAEELFSGGDVVVGLDSEGRATVDHADDAATLVGFGDEDLDRVGGGAVDPADLRDLLHLVEDVHRVSLPQEHDEGVARPDSQGVAGGEVDELVVVAGLADQPGSGRLAEGDAEAEVGRGSHQRLVEILDRLDEVGLPEDEVEVLGLFDPNRRELHADPPFWRLLLEARPGRRGRAAGGGHGQDRPAPAAARA